jgi:Domain of unknown function (DUF5615)
VRILLDECLPRPLARRFPGHNVQTVQDMGWAGKSNGTLLSLVVPHIDVFITVDRNLAFNDNIAELKVGVVVLHAKSNRLADLEPLVPKVLASIESLRAGQVIHLTA